LLASAQAKSLKRVLCEPELSSNNDKKKTHSTRPLPILLLLLLLPLEVHKRLNQHRQELPEVYRFQERLRTLK
jgi:hypothetical protein